MNEDNHNYYFRESNMSPTDNSLERVRKHINIGWCEYTKWKERHPDGWRKDSRRCVSADGPLGSECVAPCDRHGCLVSFPQDKCLTQLPVCVTKHNIGCRRHGGRWNRWLMANQRNCRPSYRGLRWKVLFHTQTETQRHAHAHATGSKPCASRLCAFTFAALLVSLSWER